MDDLENYHNPIAEIPDGRKRRTRKGGREKSKKYAKEGKRPIITCDHGRRHHAFCQASLLKQSDIQGKFNSIFFAQSNLLFRIFHSAIF